MSTRLVILVLCLAAFLSLLTLARLPAIARDDTAANTSDAASKPFPDFGFLPERYGGRVFKLNQDYPQQQPTDELPPFFHTDFRKDWKRYLTEVRSYCFEGNLEVDWRVEDNQTRRWYHVPWQHYGPNGREGIHGLTKEAPVQPKQLAPTQTYSDGQTYAVAMYNNYGGYTIGQVWAAHNRPDVTKALFPNGTVVCKLLFVDLGASAVDQVPSLADSIVWDAYITDTYQSSTRSIREVRLIQMDVMIKDDRAPHKWLFGTFQFNGTVDSKNRWDNLVPVGLQWGNDPTIRDDQSNPTPTKTQINPKLTESVINGDPELPPTHLGWNGRLNGPVDNPRSSCMSCHVTAQVPAKSPLTPFFQQNPPSAGSDGWMRWFRNLPCDEAFDEGAASTDSSLQLALSIQNFSWFNRDLGGIYATYYPRAQRATMPTTQALEVEDFVLQSKTSAGQPEFKIRRSMPDLPGTTQPSTNK